jgi:flagellar export protein FliJ
VAEPRFTALHAFLEREEEVARRLLGARERERAELIARSEACEHGRNAAAAGSTLAQREQLARYWTASGAELQAIHQALAACDQRIDQARTALHEAHRQVATFAKLRERDRRAELRVQERRFAGQLDEFAATRTSEAHVGQESGP